MKNLTLSLLLSMLLGLSTIVIAGDEKPTKEGIETEVKEALTDAKEGTEKETEAKEGAEEKKEEAAESDKSEKTDKNEQKKGGDEEPDCD